eukprot:jgi/Bigna1/73957/fgenesh1_pg.27_\
MQSTSPRRGLASTFTLCTALGIIFGAVSSLDGPAPCAIPRKRIKARDEIKALLDTQCGDVPDDRKFLVSLGHNRQRTRKHEWEYLIRFFISQGDLGAYGIAGTTESFENAKNYLEGYGMEEFKTDEENFQAWRNAFDVDGEQGQFVAEIPGTKCVLLGLSTEKFRSNIYSSHELVYFAVKVFISEEQIEWFNAVLDRYPAKDGMNKSTNIHHQSSPTHRQWALACACLTDFTSKTRTSSSSSDSIEEQQGLDRLSPHTGGVRDMCGCDTRVEPNRMRSLPPRTGLRGIDLSPQRELPRCFNSLLPNWSHRLVISTPNDALYTACCPRS